MRFFLRTRKFKVCVSVMAAVLVCLIVLRAVTDFFSTGSSAVSTLLSPVTQLVTALDNTFSDLNKKLIDGDTLLLENKSLKEQLAALRAENAQLQQIKNENEFYKNYLGIKDNHPDFSFLGAKVVAKDSSDPFGSFTVNKGSFDDVSVYDPVIVGEYLVGYVYSVGPTTCKVLTILHPDMTIGANDSRTDDSGIISGTADFAAQNKVKLYNLSRSCNVAVGDYIVTSGEGIFPEGILIGTVDNIKSDNYTSSLYATVIPFADLESLKNVMIITNFNNQGALWEGGQ